ncbi:MAG: NAD(P)H-hydrate dehydratase [Phormidesmis sp.]
MVQKVMVGQAIESYLVTAEQMQQIEGQMFDAGMPVAALMEKVAGRLVKWFIRHYCKCEGVEGVAYGRICVLAGPGHNGADALVMARELHHLGFEVDICQPIADGKPLTNQHASYAKSLGIRLLSALPSLAEYGAVIDGLFGFGLGRPIAGDLADIVDQVNQQSTPVYSIDLPSGIHTDTGRVMGAAIEATRTACLGLWKRAFMQEAALKYLGECDLISFDIPLAAIETVVGKSPAVRRLIKSQMMPILLPNRSATMHKYTAGHLLLIAGSHQYGGAAMLAGLGAIASGVGMLTLAVPDSIRLTLLPQLPGALIVGCKETADGAIAELPDTIDLGKYDAIAFGPGLTPTAPGLLTAVLNANCPILLDADGLNLLAKTNVVQTLQSREKTTVLTPHVGEFKRLFSEIYNELADQTLPGEMPGEIAARAARESGAIVLLKGPRSAIASAQNLWFNPESSSALARGGSGDVLTGLMGGLLAARARAFADDKLSCDDLSSKKRSDQANNNNLRDNLNSYFFPAVAGAVWWHSQAALYASEQYSVLGVDPLQLAHSLDPALRSLLKKPV